LKRKDCKIKIYYPEKNYLRSQYTSLKEKKTYFKEQNYFYKNLFEWYSMGIAFGGFSFQIHRKLKLGMGIQKDFQVRLEPTKDRWLMRSSNTSWHDNSSYNLIVNDLFE